MHGLWGGVEIVEVMGWILPVKSYNRTDGNYRQKRSLRKILHADDELANDAIEDNDMYFLSIIFISKIKTLKDHKTLHYQSRLKNQPFMVVSVLLELLMAKMKVLILGQKGV